MKKVKTVKFSDLDPEYKLAFLQISLAFALACAEIAKNRGISNLETTKFLLYEATDILETLDESTKEERITSMDRRVEESKDS